MTEEPLFASVNYIAIAIGFGLLCALLLTITNGIFAWLRFSAKKVIEPFDYIRSQITPTGYELILQTHFSYYRNLPQNEKRRFIYRVKKFSECKEFTGRQELVVTEEMIVLISASAVQLTFGLDEYLLTHFEKIFIYPDIYYSKYTGKHHKGDVNLGGAIAISWKSFKEGYANSSDNYNLGLHEMAHALRFANFRSDEFDRFFAGYFDKWVKIGLNEFNRIKKNEQSMLREYAGTSVNEFFSVCVEYFFESSQEFKKKLPEIYKHTCILLNQDPAEKSTYGFAIRRKMLPVNNIANAGEVIFESPLSLTPLIPLFLFSGLILFIGITNGIENIDFGSGPAMFLATILIVFLFSGLGNLKRFILYKNAARIHYPFLGNTYIFSFDNIISTTFTKASYRHFDQKIRMYVFLMVKSSLKIVFIDKEIISSKSFTITISDESVKKMIHLIRNENFLVKIHGDEWKEK